MPLWQGAGEAELGVWKVHTCQCMRLQTSPLFNSVVEWNLRVVICHSFAVKRPDRTSSLAQVKKTAARVLCIFTW